MTKEDLKKTVEYQYYKNNMILSLIVFILFTSLLTVPFLFISESRGIEYVMLIFCVLLYLPVIIYYVYRQKETLKDAETYQSFTVHFIELVPSLRGLLGFELLIPIREFKKVRVITKAIYSSSIFSMMMPQVTDYHNKENQVLYSESLHKVLVVKKKVSDF